MVPEKDNYNVFKDDKFMGDQITYMDSSLPADMTNNSLWNWTTKQSIAPFHDERNDKKEGNDRMKFL